MFRILATLEKGSSGFDNSNYKYSAHGWARRGEELNRLLADKRMFGDFELSTK